MTHEITKLKAENDRLQKENLELKAQCNMLNSKWMEAQEKLIDYQRLLRAMKAVEAMEAWFNDIEDDDEDDDYTSHGGELEGKIMG